MDLTGTWQTENEGIHSGVFYLSQSGSCLWFAGGFAPDARDDNGPLGLVTVIFDGHLRTDFTITGRWADVRVDREPGLRLGGGGTMTLGIEFVGEGADEALRLRYLGGSGPSFVEPGYREEQSWIKISDEGIYPPTP